MTFDTVIPVSYKDCKFLRKNIPWIRKNIETDVIYVITNRRCFNEFSSHFCSQYRVRLIDENQLIPSLSFSSVKNVLAKAGRENMAGWYFQQFLKIGFSLSDFARDYYLIWDSDTVPLQKLSFFKDQHILINPKTEHHQPYFNTISKLFKVDKFADYSFISEHIMVDSAIMREMISKILKEANWFEIILNHCDLSINQSFSEFETYGNYCLNYYPDKYTIRYLKTLRCGSYLFGRQVSAAELNKLSLDFDTVSFERGQYPKFPYSIVSKIERILIELKYKYCK